VSKHILRTIAILKQARREKGEREKFPQAPQRLRAPPSIRNIKYTRMRHFKNQNSKFSSSDGPHANVSPGPAVALDVAALKTLF